MIPKGERVKATMKWGYGEDVVTGLIDRDYLGEIDSRAALTIWTDSGNYMAVTIDARHWEVEQV